MKQERLRDAPENAGIDPSTIRMSKWYQESTREDEEPHSPSLTRVWDIFSGAGWTSYQVREPSENDEHRLAMKSGDMPLPLPQRVKKIKEPKKIKYVGCVQTHGFVYHHICQNHRASAGTRCRGDKHCSNDDSHG